MGDFWNYESYPPGGRRHVDSRRSRYSDDYYSSNFYPGSYNQPNYRANRSRSRERQPYYNINAYENTNRSRNSRVDSRNRRSLSTSRVCTDNDNNNRMKNFTQKADFRRNEASNTASKDKTQAPKDDGASTVPFVKKSIFKSIFTTSENDKTGTNSKESENKQIIAIDSVKESGTKKENNVDEYKTVDEENDWELSKYFGESITEINKTELASHRLPIINWVKTSYDSDNLPEYNSEKAVGGDGLSIELFYLCKYCQMFTDGRSVTDHLKSKYHYDRYSNYLRRDFASSSSTSSCESNSISTKSSSINQSSNCLDPLKSSMAIDKSPAIEAAADTSQNLSNNALLETEDPYYEVYIHNQELDFD